MTLAEAGEIFAYWEHSPPAHLMVQVIARLLGWIPSADRPPADGAALAASPPAGLAVSREGLGMPPPVLDIDALRQRNQVRRAARGSR
ncbi:MAG: hypothetical protein JO001_23125 [Alphaproteobacteria bacterium]|nr:hypothetical protein [Alphaproteobacteria bacterium]